MPAFLRIVSILIIFFATWTLVIAGPNDGEDAANFTIQVQEVKPAKPGAPWILVQLIHPSGPETGTAEIISFRIREDLESAVKDRLKGYAIDRTKWDEFEKLGVWVQASDLDIESFSFYGFQARIPDWMVNRNRSTALIYQRLRAFTWSGLQGGGLIGCISKDIDIYPRSLQANWTFLDLLRQHSVSGDHLQGGIHKGSSICANYLRTIRDTLRADGVWP